MDVCVRRLLYRRTLERVRLASAECDPSIALRNDQTSFSVFRSKISDTTIAYGDFALRSTRRCARESVDTIYIANIRPTYRGR